MEGKKPKYTKQLKSYARYSGMAFQMGIIIAGGAFGGVQLDKTLNSSPIFTVICSLLAIALALYLVIRDLSPKQKNNKQC